MDLNAPMEQMLELWLCLTFQSYQSESEGLVIYDSVEREGKLKWEILELLIANKGFK